MRLKHAVAPHLFLLAIPLGGMAKDETRELTGTGSQEHPFIIESLDDLNMLRDRIASGKFHEKYKDKYFILTNDIHINGNVLDDDGNLRIAMYKAMSQ